MHGAPLGPDHQARTIALKDAALLAMLNGDACEQQLVGS